MEYSKEEQRIIDNSIKEIEFQSVLDRISRYCYSSIGKEIIQGLRPISNLQLLTEEHDETEELNTLKTTDDFFSFEGFSDVRPQLNKTLVTGAVLTTTEILKVADGIRAARIIQNFFAPRIEKYPVLAERVRLLHSNRLLEKHIHDAIDDTGTVRDTASRELARIRREINSRSNRLRSRLQKILKFVTEEDMAQEDFITLREGRFVLPVKSEHKRHIPGIIHGISQTGSTVFLEPSETIEMNNEISLLMGEEQREIYRILANLTEEIGQEAHKFIASIEIIGHLDSIAARSEYALEFGGVRPVIHDEDYITLNKIRHPLLVHSKGRKKVMPLSIEFSANKRGHLISGPNAGGKTVALKSIGLNITMALSGIFPLGECHTNFRRIYTSIGDHQSVENDLSTFSSQILQMKDILSFTDKGSLALIDEIGSGTDPQEGSALSAGILDTMIAVNSYFVVTTHQSSLKSYALTREEIENASLEFNDKELKPTYKFMAGVPGNSYAFVLAKSLGLPSTVTDRAMKYLGNRQSELEESISMLQKYRNQAEELKLGLEREKRKLEKAKNKYRKKFDDLNLKRESILEDARKDAYMIVANSNALVEKTIKEIREQQKSVAEVKKDFSTEKAKLEKQFKKIELKQQKQHKKETFEQGDNVMMEDSQSTGVIMNMYDDNTALVDFGGMKFKVALKQLSKVETAQKDKVRKSGADYIRFDTRTSVDVRGKRAHEAVKLVDDLISEALMASQDRLTVIHGKGTGALRVAIQQFLSEHYSVESYRDGTLTEGGDGVTVFELR